jgi:hypothetical protein
MSMLLDRITGTDPEPEVTMTVPRQGLPPVPGASMIPWWTGVPSLDPDVRYADWIYAAECAAIACGIHVLGADAARAEWLRGRIKSPVRAWTDWLTSGGDAEAPKRTLALRMLCERSDAISPDHILPVAKDICHAGTLR